MFNPSREQVRRFFCEAWRKQRERLPVDGAEATAADLIAQHPEYHALLENPEEAIERDFTPESDTANPFLHLSLHLAVADQVSVDRPQGIRDAYVALRRHLDVHDAEHALIECLGETLWHAQRDGRPLDAERYLACARKIAGVGP